MDPHYLEIYNHDSEVDMTHKNNTSELENWKSHIEYIQQELDHLLKIYGAINQKLENDNILNRLSEKQLENVALLNALNKYVLARSNIVECDDMQCDMVYITTHESYRKRYLKHIDNYRKLKMDVFNVIHGKLTL